MILVLFGHYINYFSVRGHLFSTLFLRLLYYQSAYLILFMYLPFILMPTPRLFKDVLNLHVYIKEVIEQILIYLPPGQNFFVFVLLANNFACQFQYRFVQFFCQLLALSDCHKRVMSTAINSSLVTQEAHEYVFS